MNEAEDLLDTTIPPNKESALWQWLHSADEHIPMRWKRIGKEVYSRKTLVLAAAAELEKKGLKNPLRLAATDVFVEKAQVFLL